jgi:parallel beta-helix repeat protein
MSTAFPLPRSARRTDYTATAGQTVFGATPWLAFDIEDVRVRARVPPATAWTTLTSGFVVSLSGAQAGYVTVTFAAGRALNDEIRVEGRRVQPRTTDVARAGGILTAPLEREFDTQAAVLQELRRDLDEADSTVETALSLIDGVAGAAAAASAAATTASNAATSATAAAALLNTASLTGAGLAVVSTPLVKDSPTLTVAKADAPTVAAGVSDAAAVTPLGLRNEGEHLLIEPSWTVGRRKELRLLHRDWCRLDQDTAFDPTGATNMTGVFQNAMAAYKKVIIPANCAPSVPGFTIMQNDQHIIGEGRSSVLRMPNAASINMLLCYSKTGLRVENLTMDGNRTNQSAGNGSDIQGSTDLRFDGVRFINWFGNGLICQVTCADVVINECLFSNVGSHGVSLSAVNGATVANCTIQDAALAGINLGAVGNFTITGNRITRNPALGATGGGAGGIRTTNTSTVGTIIGNIISAYDRGIMLITGAAVTTVSGNSILQPWYDGIFIQGANPLTTLDIAVGSNVIYNANQSNAGSYDGIRIDGDVGAVITEGNDIRDARGAPQMQYGIRDTSTGAAANKGRNANDNWIGGFAIAAVN